MTDLRDQCRVAAGLLFFGLLGAQVLQRLNKKRLDNRLRDKAEASAASKNDKPKLAENFAALKRWYDKEKPIDYPSEDAFDVSFMAKRIARLILSERLKTVGVVGEYGCGKSSLVNLIDYYLANPSGLFSEQAKSFPPSKVLTCTLQSWGLEEGFVAERILGAAVSTIAEHVDCLGLANLPESYRIAAAATGNSWADSIRELLNRDRDPYALLLILDDVLAVIHHRLIIYLEDIDRNSHSGTLAQEVGGLLDRLRDLENVSFVLTIGPKEGLTEILARVCEHIEPFPSISDADFINLLKLFRDHLLAAYKADVDPLPREEREKRLGILDPGSRAFLGHLLRDHPDPIDNLFSLLKSARMIKSWFRSVARSWTALHGEVDLDELLAITALRLSAPSAYAFVLDHIGDLRYVQSSRIHGGAAEDRVKTVKAITGDWEAMAQRASYDTSAALGLLHFLFSALPEQQFNSQRASPQSINREAAADYWGRIHAEDIPSDEVRDQEVIRALNSWKENHACPVFGASSLASAMFLQPTVADKIEQWGKTMLSGTEVRAIARDLFAIALLKLGPHADTDYVGGFVELWRLSLIKPIERQEHEKWVLEEIQKALPVSLRFANHIYYYWRIQERGPHESHPPTLELRAAFVEIAKKLFGDDPDVLLRILDPAYIHSIYHFAVHNGSQENGGPGFKPNEWAWLGKVLVRAAETAPQVILPQLSALLVRDRDHFEPELGFEFDEATARGMFQDEYDHLMKLLAREIDISHLSPQEQQRIMFCKSFAKGKDASS